MGKIEVKFVGHSRSFRRQMIRAEIALTRSWWRRLALRLALWRVEHERPQ